MRRIHDFYRYPPAIGQRIVMCPVYDRDDDDEDWAWFALTEDEAIPTDADAESAQVYDGHHARQLEDRHARD